MLSDLGQCDQQQPASDQQELFWLWCAGGVGKAGDESVVELHELLNVHAAHRGEASQCVLPGAVRELSQPVSETHAALDYSGTHRLVDSHSVTDNVGKVYVIDGKGGGDVVDHANPGAAGGSRSGNGDHGKVERGLFSDVLCAGNADIHAGEWNAPVHAEVVEGFAVKRAAMTSGEGSYVGHGSRAGDQRCLRTQRCHEQESNCLHVGSLSPGSIREFLSTVLLLCDAVNNGTWTDATRWEGF